MLRVLTACLLFCLIGPELFSQVVQPAPAFKNGRIAPENSLMLRKVNIKAWQSAFFGSRYYLVVQLNHPADSSQKKELFDQGIRLEKWISGNNWLATFNSQLNSHDLSGMGIRNVYPIPSELKLQKNVLAFAAVSKGSKDLIAVNCFPADRNIITQT